MTGNEYADRIAGYILKSYGDRGIVVLRKKKAFVLKA